MNENPLSVPQREKSGSKTIEKFEYQYHWALYKVIDIHDDSQEYALFMELHEDVVIADSLDPKKAKYQFNQVKNISTKKYTIDSLVKVNKNNSVLGKLVLSACNKSFSDKIDTINLVASCGFSLKTKRGLNLETISIGDLTEDSINQLKAALKAELGNDHLPINIHFIIPKLNIQEQQQQVIGKISELVNHLFTSSSFNSVNIYRTLIDELRRKGGVSYDYTKWDELLKNKALTSKQVSKTIQSHTNIPENKKLISDFESIASELNLKALEKIQLRNIIERIYLERKNPTSFSINVKNEIRIILQEIDFLVYSDVGKLIMDIEGNLGQSIKSKIGLSLEVKATIIYEIITNIMSDL